MTTVGLVCRLGPLRDHRSEAPVRCSLCGCPHSTWSARAGSRRCCAVGGAGLKVGRLPGEGLHRRRLLKYAAPVALIQVLPDPWSDGPADAQPLGTAPDGVAEAVGDSGTVRLAFDPALPDLTALPDGARRDGSWSVSADAVRLTGGRWFVERDGDQVQAARRHGTLAAAATSARHAGGHHRRPRVPAVADDVPAEGSPRSRRPDHGWLDEGRLRTW